MSETMTIPVLPCVSLPETLRFYREGLGFEVVQQQTSPNVYAATRRGDAHLHFMGIKGFDPRRNYSTCLVIVPEVEQLHATFLEGFRRLCGKVPLTGLPRISRMKKGQSRFTVVDVDGNSVIFIRRDEPDAEAPLGRLKGESLLAHALRTAARLRDFKNDDAAAAKLLDAALKRQEPAPPIERARVLAARAELAIALGDPARADSLRAGLRDLPLEPEQRAQLERDLDAAEALARAGRPA